MSTNGHMKKRVPLQQGPVEDNFVIVNYDWFVPIELLRRLSSLNTENEIESSIFPDNESYESHWQLYLEHQTHPPRIRFGLCLLAPRDRCLHADVKLVLLRTQNGQTIKEAVFYDHTFFLGKGDPILSYINENISPKVFVDIEGDLYQDVLSNKKDGQPLNTDNCTIIAYVHFLNELEIQPKTKALDFSRQFTVDWKLNKFHQIIEQINQGKPSKKNDRRFVSDRFQFTHVKTIEGIISKKWKCLIKSPHPDKQTPLYLTIKCSDFTHPNYGKVEFICQYENNLLRRYTQTFENLSDNYTIEFFSLEELLPNTYTYKHDYNEKNGRFFTIDYLLFTVHIVQPLLQYITLPKSMKRLLEPVVISLNSTGNILNKGLTGGQSIKPFKEQRSRSETKTERKQVSPSLKTDEKRKIPARRNDSLEDILGNTNGNQISARDPSRNESRRNHRFPAIVSRTQHNHSSPDRLNNSPNFRQASTDLKSLPTVRENLSRSPQSSRNKPVRFTPQSRLRSLERLSQASSSNLLSASTTTVATELPESFTFLNNLFRSGLHSDITICHRDRQWNLHKSILSTRSIYFNQYFASSKTSELNLSDDPQTPSAVILDKIFLFLYTNQYSSLNLSNQTPSPTRTRRSSSTTASTTTTTTTDSSFNTTRSIFEAAVKYGIDTLALLCLQDMCQSQSLTTNTAPLILICLHQGLNGPYEKYHTNDYINQIKNLKQNVLRFIQIHSREILLSSNWKFLEKNFPTLIHDVLEFVVFEKIVE